MAKKITAVPSFLWLVLELNEYLTLRNKGLLHAIPEARYVSGTGTYRDWYRALPPDWLNGRYFAVKTIRQPSSGQPLSFQDIEAGDYYSLYSQSPGQPDDFLQNRLGSGKQLDEGIPKLIANAKNARQYFPFGLAFVSLLEYESLVNNSLKAIASSSYLPPDSCFEIHSWRHQLPDSEEEDKILIVKVKQTVSTEADIPGSALALDLVYPLTAQSKRVLEVEKPAIRTSKPGFEDDFVGPILLERLLAEQQHNATTLAAYASFKPTKELDGICEKLREAWRKRRERPVNESPNPKCESFWDYLVDYDRTGSQTLGIGNNDRSYLQDLTIVIGRYLKRSRMNAGLMQKEDFDHVLRIWQEIAGDSALDNNAFRIFTKPDKREADKVNQVVEALDVPGPNPLATGFVFLRLRREIADLEQQLTAKKLDGYTQAASKIKSGMFAALYALGLTFSFKTFISLYESVPTPPIATNKQKVTKNSPTLFVESSDDLRPVQDQEGRVATGTTIDLT